MVIQDPDNRLQAYLNELAPHFPGIKSIALKKRITSGQSGSEVLLVTVEAFKPLYQKEELKKRMMKMLDEFMVTELANRLSGSKLTFTPRQTLETRINDLIFFCSQPALYTKLVHTFLHMVRHRAANLRPEQFLIGESGSLYLKIYVDTQELEGVKRLQEKSDSLYELMPRISAYCVFKDKLHVLYVPASNTIHPKDVKSLADLCVKGTPLAIFQLKWLGEWMRKLYTTPELHRDLNPHDTLKLILRPKRVEGPTNVQARAEKMLRAHMNTDALLTARRIDVEGADSALPNPLAYLERREWWSGDHLLNIHVPLGHSHGDLHSANIMCRVRGGTGNLPPLEIIDFDDPYEELQSIFFDFAYLEFDLIRRTLKPNKAQNRRRILNFLRIIMFESEIAPQEKRIFQQQPEYEIDGMGYTLLEFLKPLRQAIQDLVQESNYPEDYNNVFWLTCVAVGLNFLRKERVPQEERTFGLLYAAYALRCALDLYQIDYRVGRSIAIPWKVEPGIIDTQEFEETEPVTVVPLSVVDDENVRRWRRDYLLRLLERVGKINLTQILKNAPKEEVNLADVYVPLDTDMSALIETDNGKFLKWRFTRNAENSVDTRPIKLDHTTQEFELTDEIKADWEQFLKAQLPEPVLSSIGVGSQPRPRLDLNVLMAMGLVQNLVITGEPGTGKSTAMRYMALCMAGELLHLGDNGPTLKDLPFWPSSHRPLIPIYMELRGLVRAAFPSMHETPTVESFMAYLRQQLEEQQVDNYRESLEEEMREGNAILLLDGLDEIPESDQQKRQAQIIDLLEMLRTMFPFCHIIVTSRTYAYHSKLADFDHIHLTTLAENNHAVLARKLFTQILVGQPKSVIERELTDFDSALQQVKPDLKSNPLFFSLIVTIWLNNVGKSNKTLPDTIGEMYRRCVDMMIDRWTSRELGDKPISEKIGLNRNKLQSLLEVLAYRVHNETREGDDAVFESGNVFTIIRRELGIKSTAEKKVDYDELIEALAKRAGIIHEVGDEMFQFTHRSFQEYLSASYLAVSEYPYKAVDCLRQNPALWRNVMELFPAEVEFHGGELWNFVQHLLKYDPPLTHDDVKWYTYYHAYRMMDMHGLPDDDEYRKFRQNSERPTLKRMIDIEALTPAERAEMSIVLAHFGDNRYGVGLDEASKLPDIIWDKVPAGSFIMGDHEKGLAENDGTFDPDTVIPESIKLTLPSFAISRFPITVMQYEAFMNDGGYKNSEYWLPEGWRLIQEGIIKYPPKSFENERMKIANYPARGISWYEAHAFTCWLSKKTGKCIALPTESQWEKAARGIDGRLYPYGNEYSSQRQNAADNQIRRVCSVGLFPQSDSPYHVQDMVGNVQEWTLSLWRTSYKEPEKDFPEAVGNRVVRGGHHNSDPLEVRVTARRSMLPLPVPVDLYSIGFRVVLNPK